MLHFVTSYMKQNKIRKQTLESAQYGLEISFKGGVTVETSWDEEKQWKTASILESLNKLSLVPLCGFIAS